MSNPAFALRQLNAGAEESPVRDQLLAAFGRSASTSNQPPPLSAAGVEEDFGVEFDALVRKATQAHREFGEAQSRSALEKIRSLQFKLEGISFVENAPQNGKIYSAWSEENDKFLVFVDKNRKIVGLAIQPYGSPPASYGIREWSPVDQHKFILLPEGVWPSFEERFLPSLKEIPQEAADETKAAQGTTRKVNIALPLLNFYYDLKQLGADYVKHPLLRWLLRRYVEKGAPLFQDDIRLSMSTSGAHSTGGGTYYALNTLQSKEWKYSALYHLKTVNHELAHELFSALGEAVRNRLGEHFLSRDALIENVKAGSGYGSLSGARLADEVIAQVIGEIASGGTKVFRPLQRQDPINASDVDILLKHGFLPPEFEISPDERQRFESNNGNIDSAYLMRVFPQMDFSGEKVAAGTEEYPVVESKELAVSVVLGSVSNMLKDAMRNIRGLTLKTSAGKQKEFVVVLPPKLLDLERLTSFAELEFLVYYNAYMLGNVGKKPFRVIGTPEQLEALKEYLSHTIFGPDWEGGEHPWLSLTETGRQTRDLLKRIRDFYSDSLRYPKDHPDTNKAGKVIPFEGYVGLIPFNREGVATSGELVVRQTLDKKMVSGYQVAQKIGGQGEQRLGDLPVTYSPPSPVRYEVPGEARKKLEQARYGFGVTTLGASTGFDPKGDTTSFIVWLEGIGIWVDPSREALRYLEDLGLTEEDIPYVLLTHIHQDHDSGVLERILRGKRVNMIASRLVYEEFLSKANALLGLVGSNIDPSQLVEWIPLDPGASWTLTLPSGRTAQWDSWWNIHPIPTNGFSVRYNGKSFGHSSDTQWGPEFLKGLVDRGTLTQGEANRFQFTLFNPDGTPKFDLIHHEAGGPPIHTTLKDLADLWGRLGKDHRGRFSMKVYHVSDGMVEKHNEAAEPSRKLSKAQMFETDLLVSSNEQRRDAYRRSVVQRNGLFKGKGAEFLKSFFKKVRFQEIPQGTELFQEGKPVSDNDLLYFIVRGKAGVYRRVNGGEEKELEFGPGARVGEWELVTGEARVATVRAEMPLVVCCLTARDAQKLFFEGQPETADKIRWLRENLRFLEKAISRIFGGQVPRSFTDFSLTVLAEKILNGEAQERKYSPGETIIRQGDPGNEWYFVREGSVKVILSRTESKPFEAGDVFGEIAVLEGGLRTATVEASGERPVTVWAFGRDTLVELLQRFPRLGVFLRRQIDERLQKSQQDSKAVAFKSMIPGVEGLLAAEHIQQVQADLEQDAVDLRGARDLASLTLALKAQMLRRGEDSLGRLEAKGRKVGKDYTPLRQARATSMSQAHEDLLDLFEKITQLPSFQDNLKKQKEAAEHLITLFQLLLLQDEADLELPYVAHSLIHSRNVQTETKAILKVSSVIRSELKSAYGEAGEVLAILSAWYHDIGYGLLVPGEERARGLAARIGISGYKTGKGYHTRLGGVLANTPILGGKTLLDQMDSLFGLSARAGRASGSRNALEDVEKMILLHGADKAEVQEEGLPGTGRHAYTPASPEGDILNFVIRMTDNLDVDANARLYLHQNNPFFLAMLRKIMEAVNGQKLPDQERIGRVVHRIKDDFRKYAGAMTAAYGMYLQLRNPTLSPDDARRIAQDDFAMTQNNLEAFNEADFPHFAGMVDSHRVEIREVLQPDHTVKEQMTIVVHLRRDSSIPPEFRDFQVRRMVDAYRSLQFNGLPIEVEVEEPRTEVESSQAVPQHPELQVLQAIATKGTLAQPQRQLLDALVGYLVRHPSVVVSEKSLEADVTLFREGTPVDHLDTQSVYVLLDGKLEVTTQRGNKLPEVQPGEFLGEIALLSGQRTATVRTTEKSTLLEIPAAEFVKLLQDPSFLVRFGDLYVIRMSRTTPSDAQPSAPATAAGAEEGKVRTARWVGMILGTLAIFAGTSQYLREADPLRVGIPAANLKKAEPQLQMDRPVIPEVKIPAAEPIKNKPIPLDIDPAPQPGLIPLKQDFIPLELEWRKDPGPGGVGIAIQTTVHQIRLDDPIRMQLLGESMEAYAKLAEGITEFSMLADFLRDLTNEKEVSKEVRGEKSTHHLRILSEMLSGHVGVNPSKAALLRNAIDAAFRKTSSARDPAGQWAWTVWAEHIPALEQLSRDARKGVPAEKILQSLIELDGRIQPPSSRQEWASEALREVSFKVLSDVTNQLKAGAGNGQRNPDWKIIASQLSKMGERSPRGHSLWQDGDYARLSSMVFEQHVVVGLNALRQQIGGKKTLSLAERDQFKELLLAGRSLFEGSFYNVDEKTKTAFRETTSQLLEIAYPSTRARFGTGIKGGQTSIAEELARVFLGGNLDRPFGYFVAQYQIWDGEWRSLPDNRKLTWERVQETRRGVEGLKEIITSLGLSFEQNVNREIRNELDRYSSSVFKSGLEDRTRITAAGAEEKVAKISTLASTETYAYGAAYLENGKALIPPGGVGIRREVLRSYQKRFGQVSGGVPLLIHGYRTVQQGLEPFFGTLRLSESGGLLQVYAGSGFVPVRMKLEEGKWTLIQTEEIRSDGGNFFLSIGTERGYQVTQPEPSFLFGIHFQANADSVIILPARDIYHNSPSPIYLAEGDLQNLQTVDREIAAGTEELPLRQRLEHILGHIAAALKTGNFDAAQEQFSKLYSLSIPPLESRDHEVSRFLDRLAIMKSRVLIGSVFPGTGTTKPDQARPVFEEAIQILEDLRAHEEQLDADVRAEVRVELAWDRMRMAMAGLISREEGLKALNDPQIEEATRWSLYTLAEIWAIGQQTQQEPQKDQDLRTLSMQRALAGWLLMLTSPAPREESVRQTLDEHKRFIWPALVGAVHPEYLNGSVGPSTQQGLSILRNVLAPGQSPLGWLANKFFYLTPVSLAVPERLRQGLIAGSEPELLNLAAVSAAVMASATNDWGFGAARSEFSELSMKFANLLGMQHPKFEVWRPQLGYRYFAAGTEEGMYLYLAPLIQNGKLVGKPVPYMFEMADVPAHILGDEDILAAGRIAVQNVPTFNMDGYAAFEILGRRRPTALRYSTEQPVRLLVEIDITGNRVTAYDETTGEEVWPIPSKIKHFVWKNVETFPVLDSSYVFFSLPFADRNNKYRTGVRYDAGHSLKLLVYTDARTKEPLVAYDQETGNIVYQGFDFSDSFAAGTEERGVEVRWYEGLFLNGDAAGLEQDSAVGAQLNIEDGRRQTWQVNVPSAELNQVGRVFRRDGVELPAALRDEVKVIDFSAKVLEAEGTFLQEGAGPGDLAFVALGAANLEGLDDLLRAYQMKGIQLTPKALGQLTGMNRVQRAAVLRALSSLPVSGLVEMVGVRIEQEANDFKVYLYA